MSDDKPKPVDDLKQGLGLLFRAAKGAVEKIPTEKIEGAVKDGAKEVGRAFESVANEIDSIFTKATSGSQPPPAGEAPAHASGEAPATHASGEAPAAHASGEAKKPEDDKPYDDAYAPEPPKGPRVG